MPRRPISRATRRNCPSRHLGAELIVSRFGVMFFRRSLRRRIRESPDGFGSWRTPAVLHAGVHWTKIRGLQFHCTPFMNMRRVCQRRTWKNPVRSRSRTTARVTRTPDSGRFHDAFLHSAGRSTRTLQPGERSGTRPFSQHKWGRSNEALADQPDDTACRGHRIDPACSGTVRWLHRCEVAGRRCLAGCGDAGRTRLKTARTGARLKSGAMWR